MKILIIGGVARSLVIFRGDLIAEMLARGHSVHTAAGETSGRDQEKLDAVGVVHHRLMLARANVSLPADIKLFQEIFQICRSIKPDIVLCYTIKPATIGVIAASAAGVRRISAMITGLGYSFEGGSMRKRLLKLLVSILYRSALKRCETVIFQNQDDETYFRKHRLVGTSMRIERVNGSGVNIKHFNLLPPPEALEFLLIARLLKTKGIEEYVAAAREVKKIYPTAVFTLVGDTDSNPNSITKSDVEGWVGEGVIRYLGRLEDVRPALAACSVYVLPSYSEGLPRTVIEAMACGRPIITTDASGCRDTVLRSPLSAATGNASVVIGENGFLVPPRNAKALKDAMLLMIQNSERMRLMGIRSREIALEKFDVRKINRRMLEVLGL